MKKMGTTVIESSGLSITAGHPIADDSAPKSFGGKAADLLAAVATAVEEQETRASEMSDIRSL